MGPGGSFLVLPESTGAPSKIGIRQSYIRSIRRVISRIQGCPRGSWTERRSASGAIPVTMGSCPKCGRRKIRKKPGKKWCPRCGEMPKREDRNELRTET